MIAKITYKGLGKLDDWYGHVDYHKGRTINGANEINVLGDVVLIKVRGETIMESLNEIESIRIVEPLEE